MIRDELIPGYHGVGRGQGWGDKYPVQGVSLDVGAGVDGGCRRQELEVVTEALDHGLM